MGSVEGGGLQASPSCFTVCVQELAVDEGTRLAPTCHHHFLTDVAFRCHCAFLFGVGRLSLLAHPVQENTALRGSCLVLPASDNA